MADGPVLATTEDYTVTVAEQGSKTTVTTKLTEAGIEKLASHANKEIAFTYQMKIHSLQYIDTGIVNTAKAILVTMVLQVLINGTKKHQKILKQ